MTGPKKEAGKPTDRAGKRRRRLVRLAVVAAGLVGLYALGGFVGVPLLIRHVGAPRLEKELNGRVTLARAACNPFTLSLVLEGLEVRDENDEVVTGFDRFEGNFQLFASIFQSGYRFKRAELTGSTLRGERLEDGSFNLLRLLRNPAAWQEYFELETMPRIVVESLGMRDATLVLRDRALDEPFETVIEDITVETQGLDTHPDQGNPHRIVATTPQGEQLTWTGTLCAKPARDRGTITLTGLSLARFMPYVSAYTDGRINEGTLDVTVEYAFEPTASPRVARVRVPTARVANLVLDLEDDHLLEVPEMTLTDLAVDAVTRTLAVADIGVTGATAHIERDAEGALTAMAAVPTIQLGDWTGPAPSAGRPGLETSLPPFQRIAFSTMEIVREAFGPWTVDVTTIRLEDGSSEIVDRAAPKLVALSIRDLRFEAGPLRTEDDFRVPFTLGLQTQVDAVIEVEGVAGLVEQTIEVTVQADAIDLTTAAPYLPPEILGPFAADEVGSGRLHLDGRATSSIVGQGTTKSTWSGTARIADVHLLHEGRPGPPVIAGLMEITGDATLDVDADAGERFTWRGQGRLEGLQLDDALAGEIDGNLDALDLDGALEATRSPTTSLTWTWAGSATLRSADVTAPHLAGSVHVVAGEVAVSGDASLGSTDGEPVVTFDGDLDVAGLRAETPRLANARLDLDRTTVAGAEIRSRDRSLSVEKVVVTAPKIVAEMHLVSEPDGTPPPAAANEMAWSLAVARAEVTGGTIEVSDAQASPPLRLSIGELDLAADSISSEAEATSFSLDCRVQDTGQAQVEGTIDLFHVGRHADLDVQVQAMPIKPFEAFTARHLGYTVESGRLSMVLPVTVEEGSIAGEADLALDGFYLAEKVESEDATDLPVKLGLDLLRDSEERVEITVPISGEMDDPEFTLGGLVGGAIVSALGTVATAPFKIIGSVFAGDSEADLSLIVFEPGRAEIPTGELAKLDAIARAMTERPALRLVAAPRIVPALDRPALEIRRLREEILTMGGVELDDDAYRAAVKRAHRLEFGAAEEVPFDARERALADTLEVPESALTELSQQRVEAVVGVLVRDNSVDAERVEAGAAPPATDAPDTSPAVVFEFR